MIIKLNIEQFCEMEKSLRFYVTKQSKMADMYNYKTHFCDKTVRTEKTFKTFRPSSNTSSWVSDMIGIWYPSYLDRNRIGCDVLLKTSLWCILCSVESFGLGAET